MVYEESLRNTHAIEVLHVTTRVNTRFQGRRWRLKPFIDLYSGLCQGLTTLPLIHYRTPASNITDVSLADIMTAHIEQELSGEHATHSIISVRRKHLWDDSITQFLKSSFDPRKPIRVIFHGEEAADGGGPRKEYFRLLSKCIREQSGAFFNSREIVNFRSSVSLFHEHLIGLMIGTSILHGGQAFPFLPRAIYNYISHGVMATNCTVSNVANSSTLRIVKKVCPLNLVNVESTYVYISST